MNTDPNLSNQSGQTEQSRTNSIRSRDRLNKNQPKNVVGADIGIFHKNLEDLMNHGTEGMDAHTIYHIKGDVIWALGPKAKHEIMRAKWDRELKDVNIQEVLKLKYIQADIHARSKRIPQQSTILQGKAGRR